jgi:3-oxoacyl-[acyl-carrier protein] reductase
MEPKLDAPVTLITGTRKGIGKFLAHHYAQQGHHVVGCSREAVDWALDGYEHYLADVSDESAVKDIFSAIRKKYRRVDHLINNAGIASMNHTILTPQSTVRKILSTNFVGTFLFCREAAKLMERHRYGRIVNLGTVAVPLRLEGEAIYAASKNAIVAFTQVLAREVADLGITCNVVGPTPIETDLIRSVPRQKIDRIVNSLAIRRLGKFEDVANVIDFFLKPESSYITGQVIYLGGV